MTRPYSEDLRERALARFERGETIRPIGKALGIDPSCVPKWVKRRRETGSVAPAAIGGRKPRTLSGEIAVWLRERLHSGSFTTRAWRPNSQSAGSRPIGARFGLSFARKG
jgi:putative transposase